MKKAASYARFSSDNQREESRTDENGTWGKKK